MAKTPTKAKKAAKPKTQAKPKPRAKKAPAKKEDSHEKRAALERKKAVDILTDALPDAYRGYVRTVLKNKPNPSLVIETNLALLGIREAELLADMQRRQTAHQTDVDRAYAILERADAKERQRHTKEADKLRKEAARILTKDLGLDKTSSVLNVLAEAKRKAADSLHTINPTTYDKVITEAVSDVIETDKATACFDRLRSEHDAEFLDADENEGPA